ncbi:hypothetical protein NL464_27985, partial [Klebsiella pneumoniae]|nr:hypothetical protein [Klebsiella pneumoniae]
RPACRGYPSGASVRALAWRTAARPGVVAKTVATRAPAAGAAAPAGSGHSDQFCRRVSGKRSACAGGGRYRHPGRLASR